METVSIRIAVPADLQREFKAACAADGVTMTQVLLTEIRAHLAQRRTVMQAQQEEQPADD